ncbi:patatin-like phospholipase family protein [Bosea sp. BK604]|uniref:patatin-like phospholipase family protein n=1 Tax=Bosea sp. BK604 TaxID=2512180 RepID=UPI001404277F|nr:patatin-like phospholipase family protein [Bosea sp. BK604]
MLAAGMLLALAACNTGERPRALPMDELATAEVVNYGTIRFWGDTVADTTSRYLDNQYRQIAASGCRECQNSATFLAISGGSGDGAYGAGFLTGWTARGDRPVFEVVTGVSTGSLIAPFAFLGSKYDGPLREIYTRFGDDQLYRNKGVFGLVGESLYDNTPLRLIVERYATDTLLDEIAAEHRKGRRLLVQSTNLDAQRPVIWDMGSIAASGQPDRKKLFVDILLASASIPAIFPAVRLNVTSNGRVYDELHVDGGVTSQIFFAPPGLDLKGAARRNLGHQRKLSLYVIRNGKLKPDYQASVQTVAGLATRSIATLVKYQALANIWAISAAAERLGARFSFTAIPESFDEKQRSDFDTRYMTSLFDLGVEQALRGKAWETEPPLSPTLSMR